MKQVEILLFDIPVGLLKEVEFSKEYIFSYYSDYSGSPVSKTLPLAVKDYQFDCFPPFFDGLLPEGVMLEFMLKQKKIDKNDYLSQLIAVGSDLVGAVTVRVFHE